MNGGANGKDKKAENSAPNEMQMNLIMNQMKEKKDSHSNVMSLLIEQVLSDDETRERLLDQSVLNDFYFEEKLKERRLSVLQEQMRTASKKGGRRRSSGFGQSDVIECNLGNDVLDSL